MKAAEIFKNDNVTFKKNQTNIIAKISTPHL